MESAIYEQMASLDTTHWWFVGRRRVLTRLLKGLGLPRDAQILEAGSGMGANIDMLRAFGQVSAFDPYEPARQFVEKRTGVTPVDGRLPDGIPFAKGSFDLACAFDVVEHVDDDAASIKAMAAMLKPGGYLFLTVPAYQWMWSRHDEARHHKRRYLLDVLLGMVRDAGLEPVKASHFNALLFPLAVTVRALKRAVGSTSDDDELPPKAVNSALTGIFAAEAAILERGALPFGLSIVLIARRPAEVAAVAA